MFPFLTWCEDRALRLDELQALHISAYIRELAETKGLAETSIKARLAAIKSLFRFLVEGGLLRYNPAQDVRGPKVRRKGGRTPQLDSSDMRRFLDSIETHTLVGLRDRALIGLMAFAFPRISTALALRLKDLEPTAIGYDVYLQGKGGEAHRHPVHHEAATYVMAWVEAAGLEERPAPLFQAVERVKGKAPRASGRALSRRTAWEMVKRRAEGLGLNPDLCTHTFRGTGITAYTEAGGSLQMASKMAGHADVRTTQLYVRTSNKKLRAEVERIRFE